MEKLNKNLLQKLKERRTPLPLSNWINSLRYNLWASLL